MNDFFIGIDLGGTSVKLGLISNDKLIDKKIIPAQSATGLMASLPYHRKIILISFIANNIIKHSAFKGIGFGFPGLVDPKLNKILSTNAKYDDALNINLDSWVKAKLER